MDRRAESWRALARIASLAAIAACLLAPCAATARNLLVFIADGLRPASVNALDAPTLTALRQRGVYFSNSHAIFPTVTMVNAAAIATGQWPGDTGVFGNTPWIGYGSFNGGNFGHTMGSPAPLIENDQVLADLADHLGGNPLGHRSFLAAARQAGFATAAIGKLGPTAMQDVGQLMPAEGRFPLPDTIIIDDATGSDGVPLSPAVAAALKAAMLPATSAARVQPAGDQRVAGTHNPNWGQQAWLVDAATRAVLPLLHARRQPFVLVYWSRDPDGTQHNQGDSLLQLSPGINGATSRLAVRNADHNLQLLLDWLASEPGVAADTDVIVTSDHGFATITKRAVNPAFESSNSPSARVLYDDVPAGQLPPGFLALDLARLLDEPLYDMDHVVRDGRGNPVFFHVTPGSQHPSQGNAMIGGDGRVDGPMTAHVLVTANGGSDSIYLPQDDPALAARLVQYLANCDYVGALFVSDRYDPLPGALPFSAARLSGNGRLPSPAIIVSFKSFALPIAQAGGIADPLLRTVQITDTPLQQGQGNHGGFGRETTFNFMAAAGPDFRGGWVDPWPASNADLAPTIARVLGLDLGGGSGGEQSGRVLTEALNTAAGTPPNPNPLQYCQQWSAASPDGRRTILDYQLYGAHRYADQASFRRPSPADRDGCAAKRTTRAGL
jgi:arylsulfatase A-like enzyme